MAVEEWSGCNRDIMGIDGVSAVGELIWKPPFVTKFDMMDVETGGPSLAESHGGFLS